MFAYHGRIAVINLTDATVSETAFDAELARRYLGGSGLATYYWMKYSHPAVDPLGPDNPVIYMTGPFTGSGVPTSGRHHIVTKSPLTGIFCEGDAGGTFGFNLKQTGYDGLIILGQSDRPVILTILDGTPEIRPAADLWGLDTYAAQSHLNELYKDTAISCIGPAGEQCILLSGIFHDGRAARAAARGGMGAVLGAKKLKAVVVKGNRKIPYFDKKAMMASFKHSSKSLQEAGVGLTNFGTPAGMAMAEELGGIPIRNWQQGSWKGKVQKVTGQTLKATMVEKNWGCHACPIRCGKIVKQNNSRGRGPEYETVSIFGPGLDIDDLRAISAANELCNQYGIDTISTGGAIAWAMELFQRGLINEQDVGRPLKWGDADVVIQLVHEIGRAEGFGRLLGQGVRKAAAELGRGSEAYTIHSKGLEFPAHDPRCFKGLASGYATSNRGACHLSGFTYPWERSAAQAELGYPQTFDRTADVGKGQMTAKFQNLMSVADSLKVCKFSLILGVKVAQLVDWINLATGWDMDFEELMRTGERIFTLKRLFNQTIGLSRKDDRLPTRILSEPRGSGGSAATLPDLDCQLDEYYAYRGWTTDGRVPLSKVQNLGLGEFVN